MQNKINILNVSQLVTVSWPTKCYVSAIEQPPCHKADSLGYYTVTLYFHYTYNYVQ